MRDLLDILTAAERLASLGESATLATVVRVEGASYRLPGARMLVDAAGHRTGTVSGGCLESDVARRAWLLSVERPTALLRYDASDEDAAWGFGLGCNGAIDVFLERLPIDPTTGKLGFVRRCVRARQRGALAHVFEVEGDVAVRPGAWLAIDERAALDDADDIAAALPRLLGDARECIHTGESVTVVYESPVGRAHVLVEAVRPPVPVVVFGAGQDAVPVVAAAKGLGWHVTVHDRRAAHARADRFPAADAVVACEVADVPDRVPLSGDTVAVVMTHTYAEDGQLLEQLLASPAGYVGVLGPRARTDRLLADAAARGVAFSAAQLQRLHAPVGLDLGGDGSEAVALSIVAEVLAFLNERPGGALRDRTGPIHWPARHRRVVGPDPTSSAAPEGRVVGARRVEPAPPGRR